VSANAARSYYVGTDKDKIYVERREQTKQDFSSPQYPINVYKGIAANGSMLISGTTVTVESAVPHGLSVGDLFTVESADVFYSTSLPGGYSDILGLRVVLTAPTTTTFTFAAAAAPTVNIDDYYIQFQKNISELSCTAVAVLGSPTITITTSLAHGLSTGLG